ncbi:hypothetical protein [Streptomyces sp. NPDC016845]|uniref:hypothetical protein n=1 Tax=Streptomyces sp. NPDC016845 TaxID=3364972 RepID=UPI0037923253
MADTPRSNCKFAEGCHRVVACNPGCAGVPSRAERREQYAEVMARADGWEWAAANFASLSTPSADRYRKNAEVVMAIADTEHAAEIAHLRRLLTTENKRADDAIARETTAEQAAEEARAAALREVADFYERVLNESLDPDSDPRYCTAVRDVVLGLRRQADEAHQAEPWPTVTDFALEVRETDMWVGITYKRKTIEEVRQRRESYRRRFPNARFRIVRWDERSTVVEADPERTVEERS